MNNSDIDNDLDILSLAQGNGRLNAQFYAPDYYVQTKDNIPELGQEYLDYIETQPFVRESFDETIQ